jgi:predicted permease
VTTLIVHNVGVEIALWTLGLLIISGHLGRDWWKHVLNPPVIAICSALLLKFVGVRHYVPGFVIEASHDLGLCGIPLGLVLSGATIYDLFREASWLRHWRSFAVATLIRIVLLPAAFLLMARYLPIREELKIVILLQAAMPAATFPIVMTRLYGQDTATAFRIVVGTTALSVLTIPLWITAGAWYLGIRL